MPSYAVLGATGNTGLSLIKVLLKSPENEIKAYCRSRAKLLKQCPPLAARENAQIFEGPLSRSEILAECLRGTRAAFLAVAQSENVPNCTVARDTAYSTIAALKILEREKTALPKLVILSSASLEPKFCGDVPGWVHTMLYYAASHVYKDLEQAEVMLRSEQNWITDSTWVKPGGLTHDTQKGHTVSKDHAVTPLSFLDLAAGMVEVANDESGTYAMSNVSINPTSNKVAFPWNAPMALVRGLLFHFFPWSYSVFG
ncbi:aflX ordB monooxygenase oxidase [Lecanosticta acicola]|uniref:AflX ordB monooxygenase oxidase n=1 Tax=Lecanosticta acicola TaxID=111012 RepID=A0AAI9EFP4_9PEZI|nr:aflX ordB monooxygenase oxidase [Lecanosticta acicola]